MSEKAALMEQANQCYRSGQWGAAAGHCRALLGADPRHAAAHHLLGLLELRSGQVPAAIEHLEQATTLQPTVAQYPQDLSMALRMAGQFAKAVDHARQSVRLAPLRAVGYVELANALRAAGQLAESEASFRDALRFDARSMIAHSNLAGLLVIQKRAGEALPHLTEAVRLAPDTAALHFNLAECLVALERPSEAAQAYRRAIELQPGFAMAHHKLAASLTVQGDDQEAGAQYRQAADLDPKNALFQRCAAMATYAAGKFDEASAYYRRTLELTPNDLLAVHNLAMILLNQKRYADAQPLLEHGLRCEPDNADWPDALATCLASQDRLAESLPYFGRALQLAPQRADTHYFHGVTLLALGDFERGAQEFFWRQKTSFATPGRPSTPWRGEPLHGENLLVYSNGGAGDALQWIRYIEGIRQRGGRPVVEMPAAIIPLFEQSGIKDVMPAGLPATNEIAYQVPIDELPMIFRLQDDVVASEVPYLSAKDDDIDTWQARLETYQGFRVGVCWQGSKSSITHQRSCGLAPLEAIAKIPGVTLISLQRSSEVADELQSLASRVPVIDLGDEVDRNNAFTDTAAIMKNLDLVISCDTSIAHLAGALGMPVWLVLSKPCDWRWLHEGDRTHWYPTMRLFRQSVINDWNSAFQPIAAELAAQVAAGPRK